MVAKCSTCKWKVAPSSGQNRNQFKWSHELFLEIRKWWFDRNTNLIFGNTASLKWRNIWTSQSRFKGQREQTLSTYVLVDFFFKRLDLFMHSVHTHDSKFRYMINITLPKLLNSSPGWDSERKLVFSPRRTFPQVSPTSPSWFWTSTSSTPTRQLACSSSMTRKMQRKLAQHRVRQRAAVCVWHWPRQSGACVHIIPFPASGLRKFSSIVHHVWIAP